MIFPEKKKKVKQNYFSPEELKRIGDLEYFLNNKTYFKLIGDMNGKTRQVVRNWYLKWIKTGNIFPDKRGPKFKLDKCHCEYLIEFINNTDNFCRA